MKSINCLQAADLTKGKLFGENNTILNITTDSRNITEGCMFVAIKGERFDGHSFITQAWQMGASSVLSMDNITPPKGKSLVLVKDTRTALLGLANGYRKMFNITLTNITGSVGKTTTKDMIADVLSEKYKTLKTSGNFNNDIGVPITLFALDDTIESAVVEIGMNHFGEIDLLAKTCEPDVGVITNVGVSHIENLGSRDGILQAKCEMFKHIKPNGTVVLNGNDDMLSKVRGREDLYGLPNNVKILWYGIGEGNDLWADNIISRGIDGTDCTIHTPVGLAQVHISVAGAHMVLNALAAAAVGVVRGLTMEQIKNGIEHFTPTGKRMEVITLDSGARIIDDSYNANPVSMKAAIDVLADCEGERVAILGDMGELGEFGVKMHTEVGEYAAEKNIDGVIAIGELAKNIAEAASLGGMSKVRYFTTVDEFLKSGFTPQGTILVKASHFMQFHQITELLKK